MPRKALSATALFSSSLELTRAQSGQEPNAATATYASLIFMEAVEPPIVLAAWKLHYTFTLSPASTTGMCFERDANQNQADLRHGMGAT